MTKLHFNDLQPSNVQALVPRPMATSTDQTSPMELLSVSVVSEDFNSLDLRPENVRLTVCGVEPRHPVQVR